ncbi:MAG TPA: DnaJ domain-containing protein [Pyrinomonadaceae bacterium]|nr:DnaJ domain-containing protein [Pyrinomonadaceae bacterium]
MSGADELKDYYAVLGAGEDAPADEIQRRYKQLAARHHPDRGGDEEEMKAINEAYGVLGNEAGRTAYDASRRAHRPAPDADDEYVEGEQPYEAAYGYDSRPVELDAVGGRLVGGAWCVLLGLVLLFLVRAHYVMFLWPLAMLAAVVVAAGVLMTHAGLRLARGRYGEAHLARRSARAQDAAFWALVAAGAYGVYLLMYAF